MAGRSEYIPIVTYSLKTGPELVSILDFIRASYTSLFQEVQSTTRHTITDAEDGHPDLVAFRFYQDEELWPFICVYNRIVHPILDFTTGKVLFIPPLAAINSVLSRKESTQVFTNEPTVI